MSYTFFYRIFDIFVFSLNWIFATGRKEKIHDSRRSLVGFLLNMVEVALYFSLIDIVCGFGPKDSIKIKLNIFYKYMGGILTLSPPDSKFVLLSLAELFMAVLLILVVFGALVGALQREELDERRDK